MLEGVLREHDVVTCSESLLRVRNEVDHTELNAIAQLRVVFGGVALGKLDAIGIEIDAGPSAPFWAA